MKTEIMNIEGKGLCLVISGFNPSEMSGLGFNSGTITGPFSNPSAIAEFLAAGKKISAIKEIRYQTGWGLKESKEYIDRYTKEYNRHNDPSTFYTVDDYNDAAKKFLKDHIIKEDFLKTEEMLF